MEQPLGTFFLTVLPAELLLQVSASDRLRADINPDGFGYTLSGTQRETQEKRLSQIAAYIDRVDSAFPNTIILAANFNISLDIDQEEADEIEDSELGDAAAQRDDLSLWSIVDTGDTAILRIPSAKKLAAIIDGQHRLFAFTSVKRPERLSMPLLCAVFLDLPKQFQAQLFATINSTQKPVDRSLTYELFGYNISEESEPYWSPDKLAVFLTRKLGNEPESPLFGRITVAPKRDAVLEARAQASKWKVSMAVVVDGITRLITNNPKRDSNEMHTPRPQRRSVLKIGKDRSPLRNVFLEELDDLIYRMTFNYLVACNTLFWQDATPRSFIRRTVGVQALFDILRKIAKTSMRDKDISVSYFKAILLRASEIDFSQEAFQVSAGAGRSIIRRALEETVTDYIT